MGRHTAPRGRFTAPRAAAVDLERVEAALEGLGFDAVSRPDRLVVGAYAFTATLWMHHERPLMLGFDAQDRIPVSFEHAGRISRFINTWNHDHVGPFASYRLIESGDLRVGLRRGVHIKHGLSDDQLIAELADTFEHAALFFRTLRERFLDAGWDQPLPPQLARAQDFDQLLGRHPSARHLPLGTERDFTHAPELFSDPGPVPAGEIQPMRPSAFADALDIMEFTYAVDDEGVVATGVNGVPFALTVDDGRSARYARATAMWDTGLDADSAFLQLWLLCNDVNERSTAVAVYLHEHDGTIHLHAEATALVSAGMSAAQLSEFVMSSMVAGLAAVDYISRTALGSSAVQWPNRD